MEDKNSNNDNNSFPDFKKNSGFSTPEKYFNTVEDSIFTKISQENLPKESGFELPASYFDNLEETIIKKINTSEIKPTKIIPIYSRFIKITSIAVAASLLFFISLNFFSTQNSSLNIDDITIADIETWYENGYGEIDNNELAIVLETSDFEDNDFLNTTNNIDLENYLDNINIAILGNEIQ